MATDGESVGIDLGTTYSCVGVWQNDRVEIIANDLETDEEVEAEPILKYNRIGLDVTEMLTRDSASCIRAHEKFLVIGTQNGS